MHAYWLLCLFVCWLICVRVSENVDPNLSFFVCKFRPFTLNFYYNVYNSEKRGNRISHYADVPNKSTRWPFFLDAFVFMVWFSPAKTDARSKQSGGVAARLGRDVWVCVCVRWNVRFSFRFAISVAKNYSYNLPIIWVFFFFLVILFCGVHISNLFAIILSFIFWG